MNETCPSCHLKFEREPGYFVGAMYISYALAVPILALLMLVASYLIVPDWALENAAILAGAAFLPFVPLVFRYSRILWMHLNWYLDPYE
jgi:Protein of unknown function (DUF983)